MNNSDAGEREMRRILHLEKYITSPQCAIDAADSSNYRKTRALLAIILLIRRADRYPYGLSVALLMASIVWSWLHESQQVSIVNNLVYLLSRGGCTDAESKRCIVAFLYNLSKPPDAQDSSE